MSDAVVPAARPPANADSSRAFRRTKFLLVYNSKGGVGKSSIAMNLGATVSVTMAPDRPVPPPVAVVSIDEQNTPQEYAESANANGFRLPIDIYRLDQNPSQMVKLIGRYRLVIIDAGGHMKGNNPLAITLDLQNPETERLLIDGALVPMEIGSESRKPTYRTCEHVLKPRGIPFYVVVNKFPPKADAELADTYEFIDSHGWDRPPRPIKMLRSYAKAAGEGITVPDFDRAYARKDGMLDILQLASALGLHTASVELGNHDSAGVAS
jgi:chromosome partitioning protein